MGDVEDHKLREELRSCQHFLEESELERARHKVFNYAVETLKETIVNVKLDHFLNNLNCAAKMNPSGSILKNIEDGGLRYFYGDEKNTLLDRSKPVCTRDHLAKLKDLLNKSDVIESCSRERSSSKWRFYKVTSLTVLQLFSKRFLWVARTQSYRNLCLKITQSTVSSMKKVQGNLITRTSSSFVRFLSICMAQNDRKKQFQNCSIYSSTKGMDWAPINSKLSTWKITLLLKICWLSTFCCMI